jgi:NADH:ubiquinone oxidoreductase subunit F (NADH-binding)
MMGSGGMVVVDSRSAWCRYFLKFCRRVLGKCVPCRVGIRRMRNPEDFYGVGLMAQLAVLED